ncbi:hypothetical protein H5410_005237 [Solanum commersonii]|uniref:Protein FAR1-RELATED SEQUENCE n=1 Tax=Solanum commersonii TaxID=4109 RepID=A0A9J6A6V5_SOLCO|nr:hypothetical protein H5410_005237 [Solanum commersonii]
MKFDSYDHGFEYYNEYAARIGFSVRREYANKSKIHGYVTSRKITCYKEAHLLPSQKNVKLSQAHEIDLLDDSGICPKSSFEYVARQGVGEAYTNYLRDKRKESLQYRVARSLINYIEERVIKDPYFLFSLHLDVDVVSFDTTYRTNNDYCPLALFVRLNNHREMVVSHKHSSQIKILQLNACKHLNHIFKAHKSFSSEFGKLFFDYEYEADFLNA